MKTIKIIVVDPDYVDASENMINKIKEIAKDEHFKPKSKELKDKINATLAAYMNIMNNDDWDVDCYDPEITPEDVVDILKDFISNFENWRDNVDKLLTDIYAAVTKFDKTSNSTKKDLEAIIADRNREINEKARIIKNLKARLKEYEDSNTNTTDESERHKEDIDNITNIINNLIQKYFGDDNK